MTFNVELLNQISSYSVRTLFHMRAIRSHIFRRKRMYAILLQTNFQVNVIYLLVTTSPQGVRNSRITLREGSLRVTKGNEN